MSTGRAPAPASGGSWALAKCPPEVLKLILQQLALKDIKNLRLLSKCTRDAIDQSYLRTYEDRAEALVISVGHDDEVRATAALRWGLKPELLAGSLVWECAHVQLASSDAKYPFEQLQIVTRSESSRNIPRPPDADRSLGEAVAKLGHVKSLHLSATKARIQSFLQGFSAARPRRPLEGLELEYSNSWGDGALADETFAAIALCTQLRSLVLASQSRQVLPTTLSSLTQLTKITFRNFRTGGFSANPSNAPPALEEVVVEDYHSFNGPNAFRVGATPALKALKISSSGSFRGEHELSASMEYSTTLETLELRRVLTSGNRYTSALPAEICLLRRLKRLVLESVNLAHLPLAAQALTALEYVELDAPLESMPPIDGWVRVTDLILRNTKLRDLPTGISALASLTRLELDHNKQQINLPADIGELASLRKLVVSGTSQAHLPSSVSRLTCLTACEIASKHSRPVSSSVLTIPNLKELTLSAGTEVSLPAGPGVLSALTLLDVTAEFISVNGQLLSQMPALRSLRMCGFAPSRHRLVYGDVAPSAFLAHATALTKLVLESDFKFDPNEWRDDGMNRNPLPMNRKIFTALPALTTLRELHLTLTGANDDVLNTALAPLTNLRVLRIETKGTTWIPDVIFTLTRLEELAARRGSITHIPNQLTALQRLRVVDLYGPKGVVLSDALLMLPDLDFMNMQVDITEADSSRVLRELVRRGVRVERRK